MRRMATPKQRALVPTGVSFIALVIIVIALMTSIALSVDLSVFQTVKITVAYIIIGGMILVRS